MRLATQRAQSGSARSLQDRPGFRPDIQGLRAIAIALVVAYHLYPSAVPGGFVGVDVFFVISGFLITGHLARTLERQGRIRLLDFYGRRARRLLPAAMLVLAITWAASRIVLPATRLHAAAEQIRASALYIQNWVLAGDSVNYLNANQPPSPVEQFWSLSVEEQFYLVWPLIFLAAAAAAYLLTRRARRPTMLVLGAAIVAASLCWSIHETAKNPAAAYFVTTARMWEFGAGGMLALAGPRLTRRWEHRGLLGWLGLALVGVSAFAITASSPFPGWIAIFPVCGTVLLIACGSERASRGPAPFTTLRPVQFVGNISYSLYLWHWPIIVCWLAYSGGSIGLLDGPAIVVLSVLLAWLTKTYVEDPIRRAPPLVGHPMRSLALVLSACLPVALATLFIVGEPAMPGRARLGPDHPGAAAVTHSAAPTATSSPDRAVPKNLVPTPAEANSDLGRGQSQHCKTGLNGSSTTTCVFGDSTDPRLTVALVGDSFAAQWATALGAIGKHEHWKIVTDTHAGCPWSATMMVRIPRPGPYKVCHEWGKNVLTQLEHKIKPDVVLVSDRPTVGIPGDRHVNAHGLAAVGHGMATYWQDLIAHGIKVVAIHETPQVSMHVPTCVATHPKSLQACATPAAKAIRDDTPIDVAARKLRGAVPVVDLDSRICTAKTCPPVVGNVLVYLEGRHLTLTYTRTLEPYLKKKLLALPAFSHTS